MEVAGKDFPCPISFSLFVTFDLILSRATSWLFCKVIFPSYRKCACVHMCECTCVCTRLFPMKPLSICYMKPRLFPWGSKRKQNKTAHIKGSEEQKHFRLTRHWAGLICSPLRSKSGMQGTIQYEEDRQLSCGQRPISGRTRSLLLTLLRTLPSLLGLLFRWPCLGECCSGYGVRYSQHTTPWMLLGNTLPPLALLPHRPEARASMMCVLSRGYL